MATQSKRRMKPKDAKHRKKKVSPLSADKIEYVDYKDVDLLRRFMSDRAKIRGRRVTGNNVQQQRVINTAIKNAREMGLLPYTSRVTTQRRSGGGRDRGDRPDRGDRGDRPERNEEVPKADDAIVAPVETEVVDVAAAPEVEAVATPEVAEVTE
jgi:small subunit ribosomal protein S18